MAAVRSLLKAEKAGKIEIVTSRETWRDQEKAKDPTVRAKLAQSRGETPVVSNDHKLLGIHNQMGLLGTAVAAPIISDIVDDALFKSLKTAGLEDADARHLMYGACNGCDRFVTTDTDFMSRRPQLEALCQGLKIVTPSELASQLSIERFIKRPMSDAEVAATRGLRGQLPRDKRKQKRIVRQAREKARRHELDLKAKVAR